MNRYWKVLQLFWSASIAAELEYRLNFLIAALSSLGNPAGSLFGLFLFYQTGYSFQGWSWEEAIVVLGVFTILQGFSATFLAPNLNQIVRQVQLDTLDFVLLKPISSQFWLSARTVSPWGFPDLVFGMVLIGYAGQRLNISLSSYLTGLLPLLFGLLVLYSLWFVLGATSIWFVKIYNVTEVLRGFLEAGRFPIAAYPASYRFFFTFLVPVAFLTTIPAEAMLGRVQSGWIIGAAVLAIVRDLARFSMANDRLTAVVGNVCDADSVAAIVQGHDAVISAAGPGAAVANNPDLAPMVIDAAKALVEGLTRAGGDG